MVGKSKTFLMAISSEFSQPLMHFYHCNDSLSPVIMLVSLLAVVYVMALSMAGIIAVIYVLVHHDEFNFPGGAWVYLLSIGGFLVEVLMVMK